MIHWPPSFLLCVNNETKWSKKQKNSARTWKLKIANEWGFRRWQWSWPTTICSVWCNHVVCQVGLHHHSPRLVLQKYHHDLKVIRPMMQRPCQKTHIKSLWAAHRDTAIVRHFSFLVKSKCKHIGSCTGTACAKRAAWKQPACCKLDTTSHDIYVLVVLLRDCKVWKGICESKQAVWKTRALSLLAHTTCIWWTFAFVEHTWIGQHMSLREGMWGSRSWMLLEV